jgi:dihydrofolate reductase
VNVSRLRFKISMSLDGFVAGPSQSVDNPLGIGGMQLHQWAFPLAIWRTMQGLPGGEVNESTRVVQESIANIGATIMGRNMFGPIRGPWGDDEWTGWWGENPPYHHPVFVLTHHPRPPISMQGGTTFHFVDKGIEAALERAFAAADGADVRLGGGVATIQQYMRAGLVDDLHLVIVPVLLGGGERLLDHLDAASAGYHCVQLTASPSVMHVRLSRAPSQPTPEQPLP